jgi:hypothetical protein
MEVGLLLISVAGHDGLGYFKTWAISGEECKVSVKINTWNLVPL